MGRKEQVLFPEYPTIGRMDDAQAERVLRELESLSNQVPAPPKPSGLESLELFRSPIYRYTEHAFGFIAPVSPGATELVPIRDAGNITPDASLKDKRIKVTLDRLRVKNYPGSERHQVLVDFSAQHQTAQASEPVHFAQKYAVMEGAGAGIRGYPVFNGLAVGKEGVAFKVFTVNVSNDQDEKALEFLGSGEFSQGLTLLTTANPAIAPLSGLAKGLTEMLLKRGRNVPVQEFFLGLDFSNVPARARLAQGSYVAVQIADTMTATWRWEDWAFDPKNGAIVSVQDRTQLVPYNYLVLSVSLFQE